MIATRPVDAEEATSPRFDVAAASEIALTAVTVSVVLGLGRLFADGSFLAPLLAIAISAHVIAAVSRRLSIGAAWAGGVALASGFLVIIWIRYPATTSFGMPRGASLHQPAADLRESWHQFSHVVAPAPVTPGFVLAAAIAVWWVAWFADWAAFRLGALLEATLPAGAIFLFTAMLGEERHRVFASCGFVAAVLAFALLHITDRRSRRTVWVGDGAARGSRSLLRAGAGVVAVATLTGLVIGPTLPGARSEALIDWRGNSSHPATRITVSPLVDIRKRLVEQSDITFFTVRSTRPAYWRLTSLDTFDGTVWSSGGSFSRVDGPLPGTAAPRSSSAVVQDFSISGLAAIWLPAAYSPTNIMTDGTKVRFDDESSTLIVDSSSATSDNMTYQVISDETAHSPQDLSTGPELPPPSTIAARYLGLPTDFPANVRLLAENITSNGTNTYQRALALQNYFRSNFTYDLQDTRSGHSDDAIATFLASHRGYCEQFAGTFAAMARSVGIPSRVAVGFTPGDTDPARPGLYIVRGRHAHAWPEVWIDGQGWLAFEPTPGRGDPGAESYTGVPAQQASDDQPPPGATSTTVAPADTTPIPSAPNRAGITERDQSGGPGSSGATSGSFLRHSARLLGLLAVAVVLWLGVLAAAERLRVQLRRRGAETPDQRVRVAWAEGTESVSALTVPLARSETEREFTARSSGLIGSAAGSLERLAELASVAHWSPRETAETDADEADRLSAEVTREARAHIERRQRIRRAFDPRVRLPRLSR